MRQTNLPANYWCQLSWFSKASSPDMKNWLKNTWYQRKLATKDWIIFSGLILSPDRGKPLARFVEMAIFRQFQNIATSAVIIWQIMIQKVLSLLSIPVRWLMRTTEYTFAQCAEMKNTLKTLSTVGFAELRHSISAVTSMMNSMTSGIVITSIFPMPGIVSAVEATQCFKE